MPKIMLDAGHYGKYNTGAVPGYYESEMAWTLHKYLKTELESYGFEVGVTRTNKDKDLEVYARGQKAKGYDLFVSLHSNAINSQNTKRVVVIHPISGAGKDISQKLADAVYKTMNLTKDKYWTTQLMTRQYSASKPTTDYYGVIRGAVAAGSIGIIIEHSFHTNAEACRWLMSDTNLKKLAAAEAKTIGEYYGMVKKPEPEAVFYRVQAGPLRNKAYADEMYRAVKAAGFTPFLVKIGAEYWVQVGSYKKEPHATNMLKRLRSEGFVGRISTKGGDNVPVSLKKTVDEIAREVIAGKWGNGSHRKERLTKAGYDYQAVQTRVNDFTRQEQM